jgi:hypothetical protein
MRRLAEIYFEEAVVHRVVDLSFAKLRDKLANART